MKIGVVGCGAVGSYYGAMLARAGEDVHFLLRSDYKTVRDNGLTIQSKKGDFHIRPHVYRSPLEMGKCDLVIIALKTTANSAFPELLPPLEKQGTAFLTLQNGLGNEERLAELFAPEQVLGGLCFVCLNRVESGVVHHIEHGLIKLGEYGRTSSPRARDVASRFQRAGVPCEVTDDLRRAHWEKLVWNIPFNGLGVASAAGFEAVKRGAWDAAAALEPCRTTDQLLSDPRWATLVRELMLEVIGVARALGMTLTDEVADVQMKRTQSMGAYRASTLIDFEQGKPLELESLFFEPLRQARQARVPAPCLEALCEVLRLLEATPASSRVRQT